MWPLFEHYGEDFGGQYQPKLGQVKVIAWFIQSSPKHVQRPVVMTLVNAFSIPTEFHQAIEEVCQGKGSNNIVQGINKFIKKFEDPESVLQQCTHCQKYCISVSNQADNHNLFNPRCSLKLNQSCSSLQNISYLRLLLYPYEG